LQPPVDRYASNWSSPGASLEHGVTVTAHGFGFSQADPKLDRPLAVWLRRYQRVGYVPGTVLGAALLIGLCAGLGRLPTHLGRLRRAAALLAISGLLVLVAPASTSVFEFRYLLPSLALLPAGAVVGAVLVEQRLKARRRAAAAPSRRGSTAPWRRRMVARWLSFASCPELPRDEELLRHGPLRHGRLPCFAVAGELLAERPRVRGRLPCRRRSGPPCPHGRVRWGFLPVLIRSDRRR